MLLLFAIPVVLSVVFIYRLAQVAPSNVLVAHVRRARASAWLAGGLLALALALAFAAHGVGLAIAHGAPDWLNVVILVLAWDAIKVGILAVHSAGRAFFVATQRAIDRVTGRRRVASSFG